MTTHSRIHTLILVIALTTLCCNNGLQQRLPQDKAARLVADPLESIRSVLPQGWIISKVQKETYPWYLETGKGTAVFLAVEGEKYGKQDFSAAIFIMPSSYRGRIQTDDQNWQSVAPRLMAHISDAKIYFSGWDFPARPTMTEDILGALIKRE